MKKNILFFLTLFLPCACFASTIPNYTLSAKSGVLVTFDNNAVFEATSAVAMATWQVGDTLKLVQNTSAFRPRKFVVIDGRVVDCPAFYLRNVTRGNAQVAALLNVAPNISTANTPTVTAINTTTRVITLSDATTWSYPTSAQTQVGFWNIGEFIMIGIETVPLNPYDAILFDGQQQSSIPAVD